MKFKEFLLLMVSSVESSVNSKIVAGFIILFATIGFGAFDLLGAMGISATLTGAFFGLSSLDYKSTTTKTTLTEDSNKTEKNSIEI